MGSTRLLRPGYDEAIDLDDAPNLCTGMLGDTASPLCFRAIVALQRRHEPGVLLEASVQGNLTEEVLRWQPRVAGIDEAEDFNRVTEEGAEALALALTSRHRSWKLVRRLQSRMSEGADWLMRDGSNKLVRQHQQSCPSHQPRYGSPHLSHFAWNTTLNNRVRDIPAVRPIRLSVS